MSGTILLTSGELLITNSVTIRGPGSAMLAVAGNFPTTTNRVFDVEGGVTVTITSLTITNGAFPGGSGGGIYNYQSTLTVSNCTLTGNSAESGGAIYNDHGSGAAGLTVSSCIVRSNSATYGGGIYNNGSNYGSATLSVITSTVQSNSANFGGGLYNSARGHGVAPVAVSGSSFAGNAVTADPILGGGNGGGIYNDGESSGSATITITASTFNDNSADIGGGIYNDGYQGSAPLYLVTSTFSGNTATYFGGGIENAATSGSAVLSVSASTFSGNSAGDRGDCIDNDYGQVHIGDSILKGVAGGTNLVSLGSPVNSVGYNLSSDNGGGALVATGDQINTDPRLGPLADNGGPTLTHALLPGSPAVDQGKRDAIPSLALTVDQRGQPRVFDDPDIPNASGGDGTDIGAYEAINLRITAVQKSGNDLQLSFTTGAGGKYLVESRYDLLTGAWVPLPGTNTGTGLIVQLVETNALTVPQQFYRIHQLP